MNISTKCGALSYLPPPWVELVGLIVERIIEVDWPEVHKHAPPLGDEVPLHLDVAHRLAHDPTDDVAQPQRLCYHLHSNFPNRMGSWEKKPHGASRFWAIEIYVTVLMNYTYMLCEWQWHVVCPLQGLTHVGFSPLELYVLLLVALECDWCYYSSLLQQVITDGGFYLQPRYACSLTVVDMQRFQWVYCSHGIKTETQSTRE